MSGALGRAVLASRNPGKLTELRALCEGVLDLIDLGDPSLASLASLASRGTPPHAAETADTYLDNALEKARGIAAWSGMPALADDSGLEVDLLGGAPGVRSARFGGAERSDAERCALLLEEMRRVGAARSGAPDTATGPSVAADRTARFRCVVVLALPPDARPRFAGPGPSDAATAPGVTAGGDWLAAEGILEGTIVETPRGEHGFGYDPVFAPRDGGGRTLAELGVEVKNRSSHRAVAMRRLIEALRDQRAASR